MEPLSANHGLFCPLEFGAGTGYNTLVMSECVVLSTGFSPNFEEAGPDHLTRPVGKLAPGGLEDLLERLPACKPASDKPGFVPRLEIQTSGGNYTVHLRGKQLLWAIEGNSIEEAKQASPAEIVHAVTGGRTPAERVRERDAVAGRAAKRRRMALRVSFAVLVASVLLQAGLVMSGYYSITEPVSFAEITDGATLERLAKSHVGVYAYENSEKHFVLAVCPNGKLLFYNVAQRRGRSRPVYTLFDEADYVFGKLEGKSAIFEEGAWPIAIRRGGRLLYDELTMTRTELDPNELMNAGETPAAGTGG